MHKFAHMITINGLFISTRRLCTSRFHGLNQNEQLSHASKSMYWNDWNEEKQTKEIFSYLFCILLHLLLFLNLVIRIISINSGMRILLAWLFGILVSGSFIFGCRYDIFNVIYFLFQIIKKQFNQPSFWYNLFPNL